MRSFSGSGGAVFLLDPASPGVEQRTLIGRVERWHMIVNDLTWGAPVLGGISLQHKIEGVSMSLEMEHEVAINGDPVLVSLPFMQGRVEAVAATHPRRQNDLVLIDDLKEVTYVP